jgi:hypothetical protein
LFATEFGASYYRGFVDRSDDLSPVDLPDADASGTQDGDEARRPQTAARIAGLASGLLAVTAGVFGVVAWQARHDFDGTTLEGPAARDADRYRLAGAVSISALVAAALSAGLAGYLLADAPRP